jgi:hypothetical protein
MTDIEHLAENKLNNAKQNMEETITRKADQFRQRLGPDFYANEVKVMAEMITFYRYSARRYVEVVIQLVEANMLSSFRDLQQKMQERFAYDDPTSGKWDPSITSLSNRAR